MKRCAEGKHRFTLKTTHVWEDEPQVTRMTKMCATCGEIRGRA